MRRAPTYRRAVFLGVLALVMLASAAPALAASGTRLWVREYAPDSGGTYVNGSLLAVGPQGDAYVAALTHVSSGDARFTAARYSPAGSRRWLRVHSPVVGAGGELNAMAVDGKGGVVAVGSVKIDAMHDYAFIVRWTVNGTLRYGQALAVGQARDVVCDGAGNAYVVGWTGEDPTTSWLVAKYDPYGNQLWSRSYDGVSPEGSDYACAVARGADGSIYVAGMGGGTATWSRVVVRKYSPGGTLRWSRTWNKASGARANSVTDIAVRGTRVALCGATFDGAARWHPLLLTYSTDGTLRWARLYNYQTTQAGVLGAVALDADGNVAATGWRDLSGTGAPEERDLLALRYKAAGSRAWTRVHVTAGFLDAGADVALDGAGNAFVVGASSWLPTGAETDSICWSIAPGGATRWSRIYSHLGYAAATDVAVTSGAVYVAGDHGAGGIFLLKYAR